ncbi:MAG TPA: sensor histidine kinase, partial [Ramlibacter sp.]
MFDSRKPGALSREAGTSIAGAVEQERARLARELHDELVQSLFAMKIECAWLRQNLLREPERAEQRLDALHAQLEACAASVRRIASGLRPPVLAHGGFAAAVEWLTREFTERTGARCELALAGDMDLPEPYASSVFRLLQESLANARKHAGATDVKVSVSRHGGLLSFCVRDDGRGFPPGAARRGDAMGITGMEERARLIGADLV